MTQHLSELVEQFCIFQRKQRGKTDGGVRTYRWNLEQFLRFVRRQYGRSARVTDLTSSVIQAWMDDMACADLALSTMRVRQSTVSSLCAWLVKRDVLVANPVAKLIGRQTAASRQRKCRDRRSWTRCSRPLKPAADRATWRSF